MNSPILPSQKHPARFSAVSICCFLLWILQPQPAAAETKSDDATLTLQTLADFHSAEQTGALKPVKDAEASCRSKLGKFQKTAQDTGNLKSVLAAKQAIAELDAGRPPLVSDDAEVAAIQKTYLAQRQKADAESAKALAKVNQDYLASLKKLVAELTKAGKIDQAVEVQAKVDGLAATLSPQPVAATPTPGAEEIEIWKKKALEEFPALKQPESELSKSVKALSEKKKATNPSFFNNPQWPYLLANEAKNQSADEKASIQQFVYLDDLKETEVRVFGGIIGKHGSHFKGGAALVNGVKPEHSLFAHALENGLSFVIYDLGAKYSMFSGQATVADIAQKRSLRFRIKGDGKTLWRSRIIETGKDADAFNVSVQGINKLELEIECPGSAGRAHSMWLSPQLTPNPAPGGR